MATKANQNHHFGINISTYSASLFKTSNNRLVFFLKKIFFSPAIFEIFWLCDMIIIVNSGCGDGTYQSWQISTTWTLLFGSNQFQRDVIIAKHICHPSILVTFFWSKLCCLPKHWAELAYFFQLNFVISQQTMSTGCYHFKAFQCPFF